MTTKTKTKPETTETATETTEDFNPKGWGQNGPLVDLPLAKLSDKERAVIDVLSEGVLTGPRNTFTLKEIAEQAFPKQAKKAYSWTRNSMRRLCRGALVEKMGTGSYRLSEPGRKKLQREAKAAEAQAA
jgi:hypothetical protein